MTKDAIPLRVEGYTSNVNVPAALRTFASELAVDTALINQMANFLASETSSAIDDIVRATSLNKLKNDFEHASTLYSQVTNIFDFSTIKTDDILTGGVDILTRAENILDKYDQLEEFATDVIGHIEENMEMIEQLPEQLMGTIDEIKDKIEDAVDSFQESVSDLLDMNFDDILSNLPDFISDKLLDMAIVGDALTMVNSFKSAVTTTTVALTSLQAPTSLNNVRALLSTLRSILTAAQQVKAQYDRFKRAIERLKEMLSSDNYLNLALSLASSGLTFFERPPSYAAEYPMNAGYRTEGGHIHEEDDTPGAERKAYSHPSGTGFEIHPDGATNYRGKGDVQIRSDGYLDVLSQADGTLVVKGNCRLVADSVTIETTSGTTITTIGDSTINSVGGTNVISDTAVNVVTAGTATVSAGIGAEVSTNGVLTLSGTTGVDIISKGFINIRTPALTTINTGALMEEISGPAGKSEVIMSGSKDVFVGKSLNIRSTGGVKTTSGGPVSVTAPLITLN